MKLSTYLGTTILVLASGVFSQRGRTGPAYHLERRGEPLYQPRAVLPGDFAPRKTGGNGAQRGSFGPARRRGKGRASHYRRAVPPGKPGPKGAKAPSPKRGKAPVHNKGKPPVRNRQKAMSSAPGNTGTPESSHGTCTKSGGNGNGYCYISPLNGNVECAADKKCIQEDHKCGTHDKIPGKADCQLA
ncbi:hypothetical protein V2G26_006938 [Clonostachys chloroleuca]